MNEVRDRWGKVIERRNANQRAYTRRNRDAINARLRAKRMNDPEYMERKKAADRAYYQKTKVQARAYQLSYRYGMTAEEYQRLHDAQGGKCAVCRRVPDAKGKQGSGSKGGTLHVDHCHDTGVIRGLLCDSCNRAIGLMGDSSATLFKAAMYLAAHETKRESA